MGQKNDSLGVAYALIQGAVPILRTAIDEGSWAKVDMTLAMLERFLAEEMRFPLRLVHGDEAG